MWNDGLKGSDSAQVETCAERHCYWRVRHLAADDLAAGKGPDPFPIVAGGAVDRETGLAAGAVRVTARPLLAADPGSDKGLAADVPGTGSVSPVRSTVTVPAYRLLLPGLLPITL